MERASPGCFGWWQVWARSLVADAPWWTEADQAELETAIWAMVDAALADPSCRKKVVALLCRWYELRMLVSKAEWLRRRHLYSRLAEIEELVA